ncbi:hypothetical protein A3K73_09160 [Candidatus Pacearchaeota archaeon RBG_13_36_9]|nr:MAG: hypothetical protein A3K73_09160 [Candidatus Pacearchaeota archaeon RBG_13_36_9]
MIDSIVEYDCGIEGCEIQEIAVAEMKTQRGYSKFLRRIGQETSDSFKICQRLYQKARDAAIKLGADVTNFPKRIRV